MEEVAERFLEVEAAVPSGEIDPMDRARFARLVRQCAAKWMLHPRGTLRTSRGKRGMALQFEGPLGGKTFPIFSLRAHHEAAEYRFVGPNPDRKRLGLENEAMDGLDRLRDLYAALLGGSTDAGESVNVVLKGRGMPDLVPLVEETRKALDGGSETLAPPPPPQVLRPRGKFSEPGAGLAKAVPASRASVSGAGGSSARASLPTPTHPRAAFGVVALRFACADPVASIAFYQRVLKRGPVLMSEDGKSATFELGAVLLTIDSALTKEERRSYGYSGISKCPGQGLILYVAVEDFPLCLRRARRMKTAILAEDLKARRFTIRDPAGYITTITEA